MVYLGYGLSPSVVDMLLSDSSCRSAAKSKSGRTTPVRRIPIDIMEKDTEFEILADVPGVQKDAILLDVDKATLTIAVSQPHDPQAKPTADEQADAVPDIDGSPSPQPPTEPTTSDGGDKPTSTEAPGTPAQPTALLRERAQCFAKRSVKLPETANLGRAQASCQSGVLTVRVPKKALPSPHRIPVT